METARKIPEHRKRASGKKKKSSHHYEKIMERVTSVGVILPRITKRNAFCHYCNAIYRGYHIRSLQSHRDNYIVERNKNYIQSLSVHKRIASHYYSLGINGMLMRDKYLASTVIRQISRRTSHRIHKPSIDHSRDSSLTTLFRAYPRFAYHRH